MISVYIDTNCINARQGEPHLNELEKLYEEGKILIEKTDTLDTELREGEGYKRGQRKSLSYVESYGPAVVENSRVGSSIVGSKEDDVRLSRVLEVLWGKKTRKSYSKNEIRDAMHISTAIRYGGNFFVTLESGILENAGELQGEFNIKVRSPENCLVDVTKRLKSIEESHSRNQ